MNLFDSGLRQSKATLFTNKADSPSLPEYKNLLLAAQKQLLELPYILISRVFLRKNFGKVRYFDVFWQKIYKKLMGNRSLGERNLVIVRWKSDFLLVSANIIPINRGAGGDVLLFGKTVEKSGQLKQTGDNSSPDLRADLLGWQIADLL